MADRTTSRDVSAREAVECVKSSLTNAQLMERFRISPQGLADLLKQLFSKRLINEDDLQRRGIRFKVLKPSAPLTPQAATLPPPPSEQDEEFLDTVALTELLSFKPPEPAKKQQRPAEIAPPEPPEEPKEPEPTEKKGKFSLTGLFKKAK
ncbi:MAG: hypothetical protein HY914_12050 [Desulfomonile tiedjei]|nr:hypothetical protein [Desulfomonile tiedjei]